MLYQPDQSNLRPVDDIYAARKNIYDSIEQAYRQIYPLENEQYKLELVSTKYSPEPKDLKKQKQAIIQGRSIYRNLHGTWRLIDKKTGKVIDQKSGIIARVPHLTERGTFIYNGVEYSLANQMRLKPGVYTRKRETGEVESHFNILPGSGPSFRVFLDPKTGIFKMKIGQGTFSLYPLLKSLGYSDRHLAELWGRNLLAVNQTQTSQKELDKAISKILGSRAKQIPPEQRLQAVKELFANMKLSPEVTEVTLKKRYENVTPEVIARSTKKLIDIINGKDETDDRDNIAFQKIYGPEALLAERVQKDAGRTNRRALWRVTYKRNLDPILNANQRNKQLLAVLLTSGLGMPLEETNPADVIDQLYRVSRMGAGGIPDTEAIPEEARDVQPSYLGFIDPVRTAESGRAGVDNKIAYKTYIGKDGQLYTKMINRRGQKVFVPSEKISKATISFPGELEKAGNTNKKVVRALVRGRMAFVRPRDVDYEIPSYEDMFSPHTHLVPFLSSIKGHRALMASKMINQAMALKEPEAPLVQSKRYGDSVEDSFEKFFGSRMGAIRSDVDGYVEKVTNDSIVVRSGKQRKEYKLYRNFPLNRRSFIESTALVRPGQRIKKGDLLAKSNFTDDEGALAVGKNLRVGFLPYKGLTFEDAVVISESAAKKFTSEHLYQHDVDVDPLEKVSKRAYIISFPGKYSAEALKKIDENGVIKPGSIVKKGDPLLLKIKERPKKGQGILQKLGKKKWMDSSVVWKKDSEGIVTDVFSTPNRINVVVKTYHPAEPGDKLTSRFGSKGVISRIVPDDEMPRDSQGRPLEILVHPFGVISRTNPALMLEAALGKVAEKTGKVYKVPGFSSEDNLKYVQEELKKNGLSDTEDVFDPVRNRKIKNVFVGNQYWLKLHHTAEKAFSTRGEQEGYTADMIPSKAKGASAKRIGIMEVNSLLSSGATSFLRDAKLIRGQKNDDYWRAFKLGFPPPTPDSPFIYRKFLDELKAAGINVKKDGNYVHLMALTDKDIDELSRGEVKNPELVDPETLKPIPGGLFDIGITGGLNGRSWTHIPLAEPLPNPTMEEPIRRLLGLTAKDFEEILSGSKELNGKTGPEAIKEALRGLNVDKEIEKEKALIKNGPRSRRDSSVKKLRILTMFKKTGIKPEELLLSKVPVLPPQFRPISSSPRGILFSDVNLLYGTLMRVNDNYKELKKELGSKSPLVGKARLDLYRAFKAITGLGDPIKPEEREARVRGILNKLLGMSSSSKYGTFQRKILGTSTDLVGRGVITPNPSLNMDQVGIPEEMAWTIFRPFIIRTLVQRGTPPTIALNLLEKRDPRAREILIQEMEKRPVVINRAPTLHRFGIMAAFPKLVPGKTIQVSPLTVSGFGADFDGDAENVHVPVSDEAVQEAILKLLPSRHLKNVRNFDIHYVPAQEYLHGLFLATARKNDKKEPRVFRSKKDVIRAFHRGEVQPSDVVKVVETA